MYWSIEYEMNEKDNDNALLSYFNIYSLKGIWEDGKI